MEVIDVKGRRFIIRSLLRINKAIRSDGVSANSTTSAFKINNLRDSFLARQNVCQVSFIKLRPHMMLAAMASKSKSTAPDFAPTFCALILCEVKCNSARAGFETAFNLFLYDLATIPGFPASRGATLSNDPLHRSFGTVPLTN